MQKKITEKEFARRLRSQGLSYSEILKKVNVSKSTLSLWLRDIKLKKVFLDELKGRQKVRYQASKNRQAERIALTREIINSAIKESKGYINNSFFIIGLMLYWAEGTKRGQEMVAFSNSDPIMINLMMKWFRVACKVPEKKFRTQVHVHNLYQEKNIIDYWSKLTNISHLQFHSLIIKKTSLKHRKNKLYKGTCCIRIYDRNLFRKIMGWKIGVLDYYGYKDNYEIPK